MKKYHFAFYKKQKSIYQTVKRVCFIFTSISFFFISAFLITIYIVTTINAKNTTTKYLEMISPIMANKITSEMLVNNLDSISLVEKYYSKKYNLIEVKVSNRDLCRSSFLSETTCYSLLVDSAGTPYYVISYAKIFDKSISIILPCAISIILFIFIATLFLANRIKNILQKTIMMPILQLATDPETWHYEQGSVPNEINTIHENFMSFIKERDQHRSQQEEHSVKEALYYLATQVAHDIRSPLAAMNILMSVLSESFPEPQRITFRSAINRVQDIANNLLQSYKKSVFLPLDKNGKEKFYLTCEMDSLVSEKRIQFSNNNQVSLNLNLDACSYDLFVDFNITELKRMLSNLLNNAVESIDVEGSIDIYLTRVNETAIITIKDNGKGIPPEIYSKLGKEKISSGKREGSGLGLYHAMQTITSFSGQMEIKTRPEVDGTEIILTLPLIDPPSWFLDKIQLNAYKEIVILDDDQNIHNVWDMRFNSLSAHDKMPTLIHLSTTKQFEAWLFSERRNLNEYLFLIDYEIIGSEKNGLEVIESYDLQKIAVLVTSRYEETIIQRRCQALGLRLLPKSMSIYIPILFQKMNA